MPSLLTRLTTTLPSLPFLPHTKPSRSPSSSNTLTPFEPLPQPIATIVLQAWDAHDWQHSSDALTAWLNARWAKSGYSVCSEVVCWTLRSEGRDARLGLEVGEEGFVRE